MQSQTFFHLAAYGGSVTNGVANFDTPAISDSILTRLNNHFVMPSKAQLLFVAGFGATMDRLRLNTPSLRYVGLPSMVPVNASATVPSPVNVVDFTQSPIPLPPIDEIAMETTTTAGAPETDIILAAFGFGIKPVPPGPIYRLRGTATITAAATTWVNGSISMDTTLPQGRYSIVGMDVVGTNLIGARLILPGASYRPGVPARNSAGQVPWPFNMTRELGSFGEFESVNLPNLEIISSGANTAQTVYLDVVRTGSTQAA